jgi:tetratricopeptide (TPR) repeat protein
MREFDRAEEKLKRALELNPDYPLAHWLLGWIYDLTSRYDQAITELRKAVEFSGNSLWMLSSLGAAFGKAGMPAEARQVLSELRERSKHEYVQSFYFALVHAGLGEVEETLAWLEKAYEDRELWIGVIAWKWDAALENILDDPRFQAFAAKVRASVR